MNRIAIIAALSASALACIALSGASAQQSQQTIVSLTFNNSQLTTFDNALPIMQDRGLVGTMYLLPTGMTDLTDPSVPKEPWSRISWEQAKKLAGEGWALGSSSMEFQDMTKLKSDELMHQLKASADVIKEKTGFMPTSFASPGGNFNEMTLGAMERSRIYTSHVGLSWKGVKQPGINQQNAGLPFRLTRAVITEGVANDLCNGIDAIVASKAHVILSFGNVLDTLPQGDEGSISKASFAKVAGCIARAAVQGKLEVMTVTDGLKQSYSNSSKTAKTSSKL